MEEGEAEGVARRLGEKLIGGSILLLELAQAGELNPEDGEAHGAIVAHSVHGQRLSLMCEDKPALQRTRDLFCK